MDHRHATKATSTCLVASQPHRENLHHPPCQLQLPCVGHMRYTCGTGMRAAHAPSPERPPGLEAGARIGAISNCVGCRCLGILIQGWPMKATDSSSASFVDIDHDWLMRNCVCVMMISTLVLPGKLLPDPWTEVCL